LSALRLTSFLPKIFMFDSRLLNPKKIPLRLLKPERDF